MKVTFWGTRGSVAVPGNDTRRYGGNTPCVEIINDSDEVVILDAGLGIVRLGRALAAQGFKGIVHLLITHPHFDHIQGFPFFPLCYNPDVEIRVYGPGSTLKDVGTILEKQMNPAYSPLNTLRNLPAKVRMEQLHSDDLEIAGLKVSARPVPHTFEPTLGFRVEEKGKVLAYIPDIEYTGSGDDDGAMELANRADYVIHDLFFKENEFRAGWGHCSVQMVVGPIPLLRPRHVLPFHYNPDHTDRDLDELMGRFEELVNLTSRRPPAVVPAREGMTLELT